MAEIVSIPTSEHIDILEKTFEVVKEMYKDTRTNITMGMKHPHSNILTVLRDGRDEFNPSEHRRDSFDMMLHFNLYVFFESKTGMYVAGKHNSKNQFISSRPTVALTLAAHNTLTK